MRNIFFISFLVITFSCSCDKAGRKSFTMSGPDSLAFRQAEMNSQLAGEAFSRCMHFVEGWLEYADSATGLIPRNLSDGRSYWNAQDAGADNYPFMVLTSAVLDEQLFEGKMKQILDTERELTSRIGPLPDDYSFESQDFRREEVDMDAIIFGTSEYMKDGLLPVTEYLGPSPWSDRLLEMLDELEHHMDVQESFDGRITAIEEINGELLQVLSRMYWFTGEEKYLDWAVTIGDHYLLGGHHPTRDLEVLRIRDHGCEIIAGLSELYFTVERTRPDKAEKYRPSINGMFDRILEIGRNDDGLFYNQVNPQTGEVLDAGTADTWGYTFNGYLTLYQMERNEKYMDAIRKAIGGLTRSYRNFDWEHGSADGYADAIEGGLNLLNRIPDDGLSEWIDSEIKVMWGKQQDNGIVEGWHGDGNFARTSLMYGLWKTGGLTVKPWHDELGFGAVQRGDSLYVYISSAESWEGTVCFDTERHRVYLNLPFDYPRINQFPEWYTVRLEEIYLHTDCETGSVRQVSGKLLREGLPVQLAGGESKRFILTGLSSVQ